MNNNNKNNGSKSEWSMIVNGISMILQIGISMMVPVGLCLFIGIKIDKWLSTNYFVLIFLFLGFAAGIRSIYTITKGFYARDLERENKEQQYYAQMYKERDKAMSQNDTEVQKKCGGGDESGKNDI